MVGKRFKTKKTFYFTPETIPAGSKGIVMQSLGLNNYAYAVEFDDQKYSGLYLLTSPFDDKIEPIDDIQLSDEDFLI